MDRERRDTLQKRAGAAGAAAIPLARPAQAQTVEKLADQVYTKLDFQHLAKAYDAAHPRARRK